MAAYPRTAGSAQQNSPCPGNPSRSHRHAQAETCPVRRLYCLAGDCRCISGTIRRSAERSERLRAQNHEGLDARGKPESLRYYGLPTRFVRRTPAGATSH